MTRRSLEVARLELGQSVWFFSLQVLRVLRNEQNSAKWLCSISEAIVRLCRLSVIFSNSPFPSSSRPIKPPGSHQYEASSVFTPASGSLCRGTTRVKWIQSVEPARAPGEKAARLVCRRVEHTIEALFTALVMWSKHHKSLGRWLPWGKKRRKKRERGRGVTYWSELESVDARAVHQFV